MYVSVFPTSYVVLAHIHSNYRIDYGKPSIERQLGNLSCRQLTIRVPELNYAFVRLCRVTERPHTVVPSSFDRVVYRFRVSQVNSLGDYRPLGLLCRIRVNNELSFFCVVAELSRDIPIIANELFLSDRINQLLAFLKETTNTAIPLAPPSLDISPQSPRPSTQIPPN